MREATPWFGLGHVRRGVLLPGIFWRLRDPRWRHFESCVEVQEVVDFRERCSVLTVKYSDEMSVDPDGRASN